MDKLYTISEVADKLGLATKTLRRWEESGKFVGTRTLGGQRRYSLTDLQILDAIKHGTIPDSSDLLTIDQAAALFGVTAATIGRWENDAKIHPLITAGITYYPRHRLIAQMDQLKQSIPEFRPTSINLNHSNNQQEYQVLAPTVKPVESYSAPRPALAPLTAHFPAAASQGYLIPLNIMITVILIASYHFFINAPRSSVTPTQVAPKGQVQGTAEDRDPALAALDSMLDASGNLKPRSLTTNSLQLSPAAPPAAGPGAIYFDAGSQTLKLFTTGWLDLPAPVSSKLTDTTALTGKGTILKGQDSLTVAIPALTPDNSATITLTSDYAPAKKYWLTVNQGSFTIHTDFPVGQNSGFNYLILQPAASPNASTELESGLIQDTDPSSTPYIVESLIR